MAENKKSVLLYCDLIHTVEKLDDKTAGELFKHYLRYINDLDPKTENLVIELVFEPIKQNLKRDLRKWENTRAKRSEAGKKSAEIRKQKATKSTSVKFVEQTPTKSTVNVTVNDNVNVTVKDILNKRKAEFKNSLLPFLETYGSNMLNDFFEYWTEHGSKDKKMRFEKEKSYDISRRLKTWHKRQKDWGKEKSSAKKEKLTAAEAIHQKYGFNKI